MRMTIYLAVILTTVYLNIMYRWDAGVKVLSTELVLFFICMIYSNFVKRKIEAKIIVQKDMVEQMDEVPMWVELRNQSVFPAVIKADIFLKYSAEKKKKKKHEKIYVEGKGTVRLNCEMVAERCGNLQIWIQRLKVCDCWGIVPVLLAKNEFRTVLVMPKPYPVNLVVSSRTKWFPIDGESYAQDKAGEDSAEIYEVREYRAGDRLQKVHWKLSAKENALYIKEFSYPIGAAVVLLLEGRKSGEKREDTGTLFIESVVSVSMALLEKECAHYVVWRTKNEEKTNRMLIRNEEDFYDFLMILLAFEEDMLESDMEEYYLHDYRNCVYSTMIKMCTSLKVQINNDVVMDMKEHGIKTFFETMEMIV